MNSESIDATSAMLSHNKLDSVQVSVDEIGRMSHPADMDRLSVLTSPRPIHGHHRPRTSSPTGSLRSSYSSRRHITRRSSGGFSRSHRSEVSKELNAQAESEFFALIELMAGITRRSTSLKEVWRKISSERESWLEEMDRMYERVEEYTEIIERKEREHKHHHHDVDEKKKEIVKISLELKAALASSAEFKRKLAERDGELGDARREIAELKDVYKYLKEEHEETKTKLSETQIKLVASQEACRHAEDDARKHHGEIRALKQKFTELETSHTEMKNKYEHSHKEVTILKHTNSTLKKEKLEWIHERDELEERLRKCGHREEDLERKLKESHESYEKKEHEVRELTETTTKIKYEREQIHKEVKDLRHQVDEVHRKWDHAEAECRRWRSKFEQCESELASIREEFRSLEVEHREVRETITKTSEEVRRLKIEKEELEERYHGKCKEVDEHHREILVLQQTILRHESTIKEKLEIIHSLHERIERVEGERDEACSKRDILAIELSEVQSTIISINLQIESMKKEREGLREKLHECETRYEQVCESVTEYHEGSNDFEYEISSLRSMLREAREQKEKAIQMRSTADRERDESIAKYEAKCREVEKLEEMYAHRSHTRSGGGRVVKRFFSNSTMLEGDDDVRSVA